MGYGLYSVWIYIKNYLSQKICSISKRNLSSLPVPDQTRQQSPRSVPLRSVTRAHYPARSVPSLLFCSSFRPFFPVLRSIPTLAPVVQPIPSLRCHSMARPSLRCHSVACAVTSFPFSGASRPLFPFCGPSRPLFPFCSPSRTDIWFGDRAMSRGLVARARLPLAAAPHKTYVWGGAS